MQVRLLGPVDVALDDGLRPVNGLRRQSVLAALALRHGQLVGADELVEMVWGESAAFRTVNTLQSHIAYLRGVLGSKDAIVTQHRGYLLNLGGDGTDVGTARRLLRQGRQAADPARGARDLQEALALWRGRPLADLTSSAWMEGQAQRLDELAEEIRRALFEARLAAGEHAEVVPGLERLAAASPLDERLHGQLMLALYRCGRQADALAVFGRLRDELAEQLGIDPSPALRDLQTAILRQDQALAVPARRGAAVADRPVPGPVLGAGLGPGSAPGSGPGSVPGLGPGSGAVAGPGLGLEPMPMPVPVPVPVPAQLPAAVPGFTGRAAELAHLDAVLAQVQAQVEAQALGERPGEPAAVAISAISGTAGVGKSALAVHWAHRAARQFPDGQLYVNLRGFDPGGPPAEPAEAVRGFLEAFGVPPAAIPDGLPAQTALYRSLLAGKRVLIVLDNARDPGQVRPLLPGSPGCLVIVTSRNDLTGLVAAEGAQPLGLDLLTPAEASDLLARRIGESRVASDPEAAREIIERCARLPLALAVVAARAAARPRFELAAIAAELRGATTSSSDGSLSSGSGSASGGSARGGRSSARDGASASDSRASTILDPFTGSDPATDVRAVFSWSCQALSTDAVTMFRLIGLHPGPEVSAEAAASLAATDVYRARAQLAELARAHLLAEHSPGRYTAHDLLRAYATEQLHKLVSTATRAAASRRILDHFLHTSHRALALTAPQLEPLDLASPEPGVTVTRLATKDEATTWFAAEHLALVAAVYRAADAASEAVRADEADETDHAHRTDEANRAGEAGGIGGRGEVGSTSVPAWQLAWTLASYQLWRGLWDELEATCEAGLTAARRAGDTAGQAHCLYRIGNAYTKSGRILEAGPVFEEALQQYESIGAHASQAATHRQLFRVAMNLELPADALRHAVRAHELFLGPENSPGHAMALADLGYAHAMMGNFPRAITHCEQALAGLQGTEPGAGQKSAWETLGYIHHQMGNHQQSIESYQRLLDLCVQTGDRYNEACALVTIGDAHLSAGNAHAACKAWERALPILEEVGHAEAVRVRVRLSSHLSPHSRPEPGRPHPAPAPTDGSPNQTPEAPAPTDGSPTQVRVSEPSPA